MHDTVSYTVHRILMTCWGEQEYITVHIAFVRFWPEIMLQEQLLQEQLLQEQLFQEQLALEHE